MLESLERLSNPEYTNGLALAFSVAAWPVYLP